MDLDRINELGFEKSSRWKSIVLVLSFSLWWNFFIACQCYIIFLLSTFQLAYHVETDNLKVLRYIIDSFYLLDVICVLAYIRKSEFRKLRYTKVRSWIFIFLDIISLLPFELVYEFHYVSDNENLFVARMLIQNRCLRIYRIFQLETFYESTIRKTSQFLFYMFLQYTTKAILLGHLTCCFWANVKHSSECDLSADFCFFWNFSQFLDLVLFNWSGPKESYRLPWERVIILITLLSGLLLNYVYFYPNTLFVSMQLNNNKAMYYEKKKKLRRFVNNMVPTPELKEKITKYFQDVWLKESGDENLESMFENIPLALQKEIFTDIYWEAFRHSELFRDVSRSCKRSLSLVMKTSFYHAGQKIYMKEETKMKMMFLVEGIIQIMAEENEESPVLSFSSGTVFGEFSLFHICQSQALLTCKSYCELQILQMQDAIRTLRDYPKDRKMVFYNLTQRLEMAKATQWRKQKFHLDLKMESLDYGLTNMGVEDCVKWLKAQWRVSWEGHQRHKMVVRAKEEGLRLPSWHRVVRPEVKIEFISNYLDLIVLSDALEERKDVVCLRTKFPWSINPSAPFLKKWKYIVLITSFIPAVFYPFCTGWLTTFPPSIYVLSFVVTIIFFIDLVFTLLTAVKTKHGIITQFSSVLCMRIQQPTFFFDILAAIPYQLYLISYADVHFNESYVIGVPLQMAIFKFHVFLSLKVPLSDSMDKLNVIKHSIVLVMFAYWISEVIQLVSVRDMLHDNRGRPWLHRFLLNKDNKEYLRFYVASFIRSFGFALGVPDYLMYADSISALFCFSLTRLTCFFAFALFLGDFYGAHTVKIYAEENFLVLLKRIKRFLQSANVSPELTERLVNIVKFQWDYNLADYFSGKISVGKSIPKDLRDQLHDSTTDKTLRLCSLFTEESPELLRECLQKSYVVAIPMNTTLVMYGQINHTLSIIHRGFCQVTSFLLPDVYKGVGGSFTLGPGSIFPILSAFSNSPCVENIYTITDCELLMIQLNDLLTLFDIDYYFRDLVEVAKTEKLVDKLKFTKPGFTRPKKKMVPQELLLQMYKESFKKLGKVGKFVHCLCPKYFKSNKLFRRWETAFSCYLCFLCLLWPCCFGLLLYASHILIPVLFLGNLLMLTHLILQFYAPFYNKLGILVTHPLQTSYNYLSTTFFYDLVISLPVFYIYRYLISNPYEKPLPKWVGVSFLQHSLLILRVIGFLGSAEGYMISKYVIRLIKIVLFFILLLNYAINYAMFLAMFWQFSDPFIVSGFTVNQLYQPDNPDLLAENSTFHFFVLTSHWVLASMVSIDYVLMENSGVVLGTVYMWAFLGLITKIYLYTWISSNSVFANISGTIFKERITSLVKYLEFEKADDKLIEYAISYYNLEWSLTGGENLENVFKNLPMHLHEELVYPLYRPTFVKNELLFQADEGFFKILSTKVKTAYFNRGSVVIFHNECQSYIYFIHRGKCFVYDWFLVLDVGSMIGDLQKTGLMVNKIYALTHLEVLKIRSVDFFSILNNYDDLEANFMYSIKNSENFYRVQIPTDEYQLRPVDSRDVLNAFGLQNKDVGFEDQSAFEDIENTSIQLLKSWKSRPEEKLDRLFAIYPGSWRMKAYAVLYLFITYCTYIFIPIIFNFGALTYTALICVGVLDILWIIVIFLGFRVGYIDKTKGDVITDFKYTARRYATKWDGLTLDTLAVVPFEFLPMIFVRGLKKADPDLVAWLRIFRLLRGFCVFRNIMFESRKITINVYIKYIRVILYMTVWLNFLACIFLGLTKTPSFADAKKPHEFGAPQIIAYLTCLEYVVNFVTSANLCVMVPDSITQLLFINLNCIMLPCIKGFIISQVLSILFVKKLAMSVYKSQVVTLENFLETNDTSPSIIKEVVKYKLNLLLFGRSENMPVLLKLAPSSLRISIMKDLYLHHFINFPLFEDVEAIFLEQLVGRLGREIYFPGQKIVEQFDVDHRMYFIHMGEVYLINQTKDKAYVEFVVARKKAGDYFGEAQGLWYSVPHKFTYRARTVVEIMSLHEKDWADLRGSFPNSARKIFKKAKSLRII